MKKSQKKFQKETCHENVLRLVTDQYIYRRCEIPFLPLKIKSILCKHDCSMAPITANPLGVCREKDLFDSFCGPSPTAPQLLSTAAGHGKEKYVDVGEELRNLTKLMG